MNGRNRHQPERTHALAEAIGLAVQEEDLGDLAEALQMHFASMSLLREVDVSDMEPALVFRATWDD